MAPLSLKIILENGAVTRTVMFDSSTKVADAFATIKEKVLNADDGKEYALFLTSADDDKSGIWLEAHRPLDYYMLRNGDCLHYLRRQRNLRVKMLDGSVKTLQVDESKNIGDLMIVICGKIGITNHDEYGLCQEDPMEQDESKENRPASGTLTLKRKKQERERDAKMDQLSKKLKTDDNVDWLDQHRTLREVGVDPNETLLLKRRLFYSDRNVDSRDPVQLNLLYVQTRDAILNGRHPVTEAQARLCKQRWVNIRDMMRRKLRERSRNPNAHQVCYQYRYEENLQFMIPHFRETPSIANVTRDVNVFDQNNSMDDFTENVEFITDTDDNSTPNRSAKRLKDDSFDTCTDKDYNSTNDTLSESKKEFVLSKTTDPLEVFLMSIGSTLRKFSPYYLNQAKSKIFQIVQDYELKQICNGKDGC